MKLISGAWLELLLSRNLKKAIYRPQRLSTAGKARKIGKKQLRLRFPVK